MIKDLSIVIIALNEEKYIYKLLNSLVNQTLQNFEVIVVNNNSKDRTKEVAKSYSNKIDELKVVDLKEINGPGYAKNFGAKFAKYKNLLFIDADSICNSDFIEKIYIQKSKKDFLIATFLFKKDQRFWINVFYTLTNCCLKIMKFFGLTGVCGGLGIFCPKEIHEKIGGFQDDIIFGEDTEYVKLASKFGKHRLLNIKVSSSPRRYNGFKSVLKAIKKILYVFFTKNKIRDKRFYPYGEY